MGGCHNMIKFKALDTTDVQNVWLFIGALIAESAEVSFTEVSGAEEVQDWVNSEEEMVYLAYENDQLMGILKGRRESLPEKQHAVFLTAAIQPIARGKHLAKALTEYALGEMKQRGVLIARIYVYSDNIASLNAVKKLNFEQSGIVKMHHKDLETGLYVDDYIFHKLL